MISSIIHKHGFAIMTTQMIEYINESFNEHFDYFFNQLLNQWYHITLKKSIAYLWGPVCNLYAEQTMFYIDKLLYVDDQQINLFLSTRRALLYLVFFLSSPVSPRLPPFAYQKFLFSSFSFSTSSSSVPDSFQIPSDPFRHFLSFL